MELKRVFLPAILLIFLIIQIGFTFAIDLEIEENPINDIIIVEFDNPAIFDFIINNTGETDEFELYSLVGVDITPTDSFEIKKGESKIVRVEVIAGESVKKNPGYLNFAYKIKGKDTGTQEERLRINIINLKDAIYLSADSISPDSDKTTVHIQNQENFDFGEIEAEVSSVFFNFKKTFTLPELEKRSFQVDLNKDEFGTLIAGAYLLKADIKVNNITETIESTVKFLEKSGLAVQESKEGFIISRYEIEKKNEGNLVTIAEVSLQKNIISRLFTSFNIPPNKVERSGFTTKYTWQQEINPSESLTVVARTNWLIPFLIIIAIVVIIILARIYLTADVMIRKKINFVKTKGGEFALKVSVKVRAKKFVERISVVDKLPPIVKLYERYGTIAPDRVDERNRRIEWNIESLDEGEDRLFSYIIYSKIGVVGKFELPPAKAIYEREGKIKETSSNKVYFVSEPKKSERVVLP